MTALCVRRHAGAPPDTVSRPSGGRGSRAPADRPGSGNGQRIFSLESLGRPEPAESLGRIAARHGASPARIELAWTMARSPVVLPIPGTSSVSHVEDNIAAAGLRLTKDDLVDLDALPH
ncbi:aldo/keto reductase [Streptomyces sp. NBC_00233]|uniref:aldo/keto reductase n=1 Tax=Streptomyces sp. NBC_00233 TaxID=2975686 RepID=UPI002251B143|nr:aldo/keto reductase [Streptomyces sp. NBC_00233]MCX5227171.1 aldo/keto reductase [Streptomyces sp. NBC_00233]